MNRDDAMIFLRAILIAAIIVFSSAAAFAQPCPPKRYACWMVQAVEAKWGWETVANHARSCGWTEIEINRARRCLK